MVEIHCSNKSLNATPSRNLYRIGLRVRGKQRQYNDLKHPIKGLHSIAGDNYQHIMVDKEANCLVDDLKKKSDPTTFKAKGDHVHKTYFSQGELAVCSKGTTLQIWDVNKAAMVWQAKNVSNDELSL